jgi:cell division protein ZapA (FtsZ GTPase activity inhibitor)
MSTKKNLVRVTIMSEEYAIRSDESPEHTRAVAAYLDQAIRRVMESGSIGDAKKASILAALQITGELVEARVDSDMTKRLQGLAAEVRRLLPTGKRGEPAA